MRLFKAAELAVVSVVSVLLVSVAARTYSDTAPPDAIVDAFHDILINAMQAADYEARAGIIEPAVDQYFHDRTIARISLGLNWKGLTEREQHDYQDLMNDLIVSTYASRFDNFDGQIFAVLDSKPLSTNRVRVKSQLTARTEIVSLDYQLVQDEDSWRIYDIVANGVSDLSLKRSNYAAMFKSGGLIAVRTEIKTNIERNRIKNIE